MRRALVIGSAGQDGWYLAEQLISRGVEVAGLTREGASWLHGARPLSSADAVLDQPGRLAALVDEVRPDALFYLAATFGSSEQRPGQDPAAVERASVAVHVEGWQHALDAMVRHVPACRAFYAGSSHVFGAPPTLVQDEETPFSPLTVYARTKVQGIALARAYRRRGHHVSVGLLYNHESPRRPLSFVTQRVAHGAARAAAGDDTPLELGDLTVAVDWSFAGDVTEAMQRIVEHPEPGDYVVASGVARTVAQLCEACYGAVGLDWRRFVRERKGTLGVPPVSRVGDASKLRRLTGWSPRVSFEALAQLLVEAARLSGAP